MVGVAGGTVQGPALDALVEDLDREEWYETEQFEVAGGGVALVHHGAKDPDGHATWRGDAGAAVRYGTFANLDRVGLDVAGALEAVLERPTVALPKLDGPFLVAGARRDGTLLVATDRLGSRSCYYAGTPDGVVFASGLGTVLSRVDDVALDRRAAGDLLTFGFVVGEKTLADGVRALQPASLLRFDGEDLSVRRYWTPGFGRLPEEGYVERTAEVYRRAVSDVAGTLSGRVGLWLSGGLDSRTMAAVLREEYGSFRTLTYDANPRDGSNVGPAREVADRLGVDNRLVEVTPERWGPLVERGVALTGGMTSWSYFLNPKFVFDRLHGEVDVVLEGAPQGELLGEGLWAWDLANGDSVAGPLLRRLAVVDPDLAGGLLAGDGVDPAGSLRAEAAKSDQSSLDDRILDVWLRNFASNAHFRTNRLSRSQVGMRLPFTAGALLDHVAAMPYRRYRRDAVPFTGGRIPRSMAPLKREVLARLDGDLAGVPYERTRIAPSRPLWVSDAAYLAKQAWWELVSGRPTEMAGWLRDDPRVRGPVARWLDAARDRPEFDGDALVDLLDEHLAGEANHVQPIAAATTLERFLAEHAD